MNIVLRRTSRARHTLEIARDDGSRDSRELDTKTFLIHDLLHYAVESLAALHDGVWGTIAQGATLEELGKEAEDGPVMQGAGLSYVEMIVGALTGVVKGIAAPIDSIGGLQNLFEASKVDWPEWLDEQFIQGVLSLMRRLIGEWNSLEIGKEMNLVWK